MEQHKKRLIVLAAAALAVIILLFVLSGIFRRGSGVNEEPLQAAAGTPAYGDETQPPESTDAEKETVTVELAEDFRVELGENESIGGF